MDYFRLCQSLRLVDVDRATSEYPTKFRTNYLRPTDSTLAVKGFSVPYNDFFDKRKYQTMIDKLLNHVAHKGWIHSSATGRQKLLLMKLTTVGISLVPMIYMSIGK